MSFLLQSRKILGSPPNKGAADIGQRSAESRRMSPLAQVRAGASKEVVTSMDEIKNDLRPYFTSLYEDEAMEGFALEERVRREVEQHVTRLSADAIERLVQDFVEEITGMGAITPFFKDNTVTEIMVNKSSEVYIERNGSLIKTATRFSSEEELLLVIDRILRRNGKSKNVSDGLIEASLDDGSRLNAILPPASVDGVTLSIRRFGGISRLTMSDLVSNKTLPREVAEFLRVCVQGKLNIVISGGSGTGKSTLLNCLSEYIPEDERIFTIEDVAELELRHPHVIRLLADTPPVPLTARELLRKTVRMRPDRIIIGECRGDETVEMLEAMRSGHDGSITTIHASSSKDALHRLENMVLMAGIEMNITALRQQIVTAVDLLIHLMRDRNGRRYIDGISEVTRLEGDTYVFQDLFTTQPGPGNMRVLTPTGVHPNSFLVLERRGIHIPSNVRSALMSV